MTVMSEVKTVGRYLLDKLHAYGVRHIFGVPGDYVLLLNKLIEEHPIRFINTTQENSAGYMADLYGRMHGLGVATITYGVGISIANALAQAYVEDSPLLVISGAPGAHEREGHPYLHHLINRKVLHGRDKTQMEIFRPLTIDHAILSDASHAKATIDRLLYNCVHQKKPVYIEFPRDSILAPLENETEAKKHMPPKSDPEALDEVLNEMAVLLKEARRPCIWLGHEVQRFNLLRPILSFAERLNIPIATSLLGKGALGERHPLFLGVYQGAMSFPEVRSYVEESDLLLLFGVLLSDMNTGAFSTHFEQEKRVTASLEEISVNHHRYQEVHFVDFIEALPKVDLPSLRFRLDYPACIDRPAKVFDCDAAAKITSERFFTCLAQHIAQDHILIADIGDSLFGCTDIVVEQNAFYGSAFFASLGFGIPAAVAAQLVAPKKRVVAVVGDGSFQMTAMELTTALRYGLDPIVVVLNNHGFGTERPIIEGEFNELVNWRYSALPELLGGGRGCRVTTEGELEQALTQALQERGTYFIIEVELEKNDVSAKMAKFNEVIRSLRQR